MNINFTDTIAAISTSGAQAGIGIVRISGPGSLSIADKIFVSPSGSKPSTYKTYTVHYGWVINPKNKEIIDEVILTLMRSPRSFTREDVVEINCHGGIVATRAVLELVLANGSRLAEPGEFTKRAFLNGRIDLTQAEAVLDVISAKTDAALKLGTLQLKGYLSNQINKIRDEIIDLLSLVEANIDFPEDDITDSTQDSIKDRLSKIIREFDDFLLRSQKGKVLRDGLHCVICGRPNVGKSSLLNALLKEERSIVTHIAGTTRDTIEEIIDIKGIPVRIVDTAGILEPRDLIEKKAVSRSKEQIKNADLVFLVFDASRPMNKDDYSIIRKVKKNKTIAIINKIDKPRRIAIEKIRKCFPHIVELSARNMKNINLLEDKISDLVLAGSVSINQEAAMSNLRHIELIKKSKNAVIRALNSEDKGLSWEFVSEDIKQSVFFIDEILGKNFSEDLLDNIFSNFCIGK